MKLNDYELAIIHDTKFLITKFEVITKITSLLDTLNRRLSENIHQYSSILSPELLRSTGKISRGENYRQLPYLVLDAPRHFNRHDLMVFRSMFWWGHEFSFTLHLQGSYLHQYLAALLSHIHTIQQQDVYICVNSSPWEYHFDEDNYVPASSLKPEAIMEHARQFDFIKISRTLTLEDIAQGPAFGWETFELYMGWLQPDK